jgi:hypothetical protein
MMLWRFLILFAFINHLPIHSLNLLNLVCLDFCSLHLQLLEQTIFTILQNGPQVRYASIVVYIVKIPYDGALVLKFSHNCSSFQGSLNKFNGQHALRERARKLDQGILIIR